MREKSLRQGFCSPSSKGLVKKTDLSDATRVLGKTPKVQRLQVASQNTRRNFRPEIARKRGESNFLRAFERAYLSRLGASGFVACEFALPGYGVADLVWIGWDSGSSEEEFTAFSVEK